MRGSSDRMIVDILITIVRLSDSYSRVVISLKPDCIWFNYSLKCLFNYSTMWRVIKSAREVAEIREEFSRRGASPAAGHY